jgi:uncharacterized protein YkwD
VGVCSHPRIVSGAAIVLAAAILVTPALSARKGAASSQVSLASHVLTQLNEVRVANGLVPLKPSSSLSAAAEQHSAEMLADGYFAHDSANGSPFWRRIQRYYPSHNGYWSVGENLIWSSGSLGATSALKLWLSSPEHRANILNPHWREIGVAALSETDAPGTFGGDSVTLVTTDFGVRR